MPETLELDVTKREVCDAEGYVLREGALVLCKHHGLLARIAIIPACLPSCDTCRINIRFVGDTANWNSCYAEDLQLISSSLQEVGKEPSLPVRIDRLRRNMDSLLTKVSNSSDARLLGRFRTLLRFGPSGADKHLWFWNTVAESFDDPRKISYAPSMDLVDNDRRRRCCAVSRFLKNAGRKAGACFTDTEADRIAYLIGTYFPDGYDYRFEVVSGMEIVGIYNIDECEAGFQSCMTGHSAVKWYAANPDKVSLLVIYSNKSYRGRALLWTTDQGQRVLDRIYPSDKGPQIQAAIEYAKSQGWDYKERQTSEDGELASGRMDYTITMSAREPGLWVRHDGFPYIDTFKYTNDNPDCEARITLCMEGGSWTFDDTEGDYSPEAARCAACDEAVREDQEWHDGDDNVYCYECYHDRYTELCYRLLNGRLFTGWYQRDDTVECCKCSQIIWYEHSTSLDEENYCPKCSAEHITSCPSCGDTVLKSAMDANQNCCSDCVREKAESSRCNDLTERNPSDVQEPKATAAVTEYPWYAWPCVITDEGCVTIASALSSVCGGADGPGTALPPPHPVDGALPE
jgi:hypothetical protein